MAEIIQACPPCNSTVRKPSSNSDIRMLNNYRVVLHKGKSPQRA